MIKWIIVISFIANNAFEAIVEYLNSVHLKTELPANVRDVYDESEYKRWLSYEKDYGKCYVVEAIITDLILLLLLACDSYAHIFSWFAGWNQYVQYLFVILVFTAITTILSAPFDYYQTFVLEEKYGMNKTTRKTFFTDFIKSLILGTLFTYLIMAVILFLFENFGNMAVFMTMGALIVIALIIAVLAMPLMRLFNKFKPLEDGELKDSILALCDKYGVTVKKIVVKDASRRTTKSNAFCTGFKMKTISLDDNLISSFDPDEIVAVFAHEFAHAKYRHTMKSLPFAFFRIILMVGVMGLILNIPVLFTAFGFEGINYYFAMVLMGPIIWPLQILLQTISNSISRKHEYQADAFAAKEGYGGALIRSLKKLHQEALSDINPHPLKVFLDYSHPTLSQRIEAIEHVR